MAFLFCSGQAKFVAMFQRHFSAVSTFTLKGKILVALIRVLGSILHLFFGNRPKRNFEENPASFNWKDILYFAHKYYLFPPEKAESDRLEHYFNTMKFVFPNRKDEIARLSLSAGGDLMPYAWLNAENTKQLWTETGDWYFGSDIVFANLETPIQTKQNLSAVPEVMLNDMHFNGSESLFNIFSGFGQYKGYDILSTANNHSLDMGIPGIESTINYLKEKGIPHTGTALTPEDQWEIPIIERNGIRVAFVAATYCLNHLHLPEGKDFMVNTGRFNLPNAELSLIKKLVEKARQSSDFVVLSFHNGNAYQAYPSEHTVENVHRVFEECGPDLILGSHPHNPQPIEQYSYSCPFTGTEKKGIAVYSQGDYIAYDIFTWCHLHLGIKFTLSKYEDGQTLLSGMEVMPQFFWHGDKNGFDFQLLRLNDCKVQEKKMKRRSKKELRELRRFWTKFLAPSLAQYETAQIR